MEIMTLVDLYIMEVFDYTKIFACIRGLNAGYGTTQIQCVGLAPKFTISATRIPNSFATPEVFLHLLVCKQSLENLLFVN